MVLLTHWICVSIGLKQKKLWNPRLCPLPPVTLNHLCTSGSAYARMFIATKLRVAFRAQASANQTLRNPEKPSVCVKPVKPVHEPIWRFFLFRSTCLSAYLYANFLLCN
jgi:hypothetical protein